MSCSLLQFLGPLGQKTLSFNDEAILRERLYSGKILLENVPAASAIHPPYISTYRLLLPVLLAHTFEAQL